MTASTINLELRTPHAGQRQVLEESDRFNVLCCGRRWGKTEFGVQDLAIEYGLEGKRIGWFAPTYKLLLDAWNECTRVLAPLRRQLVVSKTDRRIDLPNRGVIEFWSTEPAQAGDQDSEVARGRKYHRAIYDEAARARRLEADWTRAIRPTLADYRGDAWFLSTPKGQNYFYRLWCKGEANDPGWKSWQMPTLANPYIHPDEIEDARHDLPRDAFEQEHLAEFLANAANPFGIDAIRSCVRDCSDAGRPVAWGVDLAKSTDWTVAIGLDEHGRVAAFQRWQSDWRNTTARVSAMISEAPACIDSTGVGDPIVEEIQARGGIVEPFKFTSSSKQQLMEGLAWAIQNGRVSFPAGPIQNELEAFEYDYRPSGVRYTAPEGMHDDCVDALALAWRCVSTGVATMDLGRVDDGKDARWFDRVEDDSIWT